MEAAVEFATEAGALTLAHFGSVVSAESKRDGSPVTLADREAESRLRDRINGRFPTHGILGEEYGEYTGSDPIRWIVDPIDGTRSFMRGVPLYAVLIGIEVEDIPVVGVAHFPALGETVAAGTGLGCRWWQSGADIPRVAQVSEVRELSAGLALTTDPERILTSPVGEGWMALSKCVEMVRGWGDAYGHALVATGRAEIMVDPALSAWDAAPLLPILSESGGQFTDLKGEGTIHGGSGISTNGMLHATVLDLLTSGQW